MVGVAMTAKRTGIPGPGVDALGQAVVDPTQNVLDLVEAAIKRQDDLRTAESRHLRELANIRATFGREIRKAEADRLDALRAVDQGAIAAARAADEIRATALAKTLADAAEAVRTTMAAAATAQASNVANIVDPITKAISEIREIQYREAGQRAQVIESKGDTRDSSRNVGLWIGIVLTVVSIGIALFFSILTAAFGLYALLKK
jgi:hypothetical protein